ncbi:ribonuclease J1 [Brevibacillus daliensis]|uniref:ribonuclease J1 n=1 Tax=Brevibacillus daliensis TaxID=2892995 RepID=UPI002104E1F2|nr:ribonuclease J [Brevibacillus daliensis]
MSEVKIYGLGGLGEIGKNMYCVEYEDEIIIIDCGVKFPETEMFGIDLVIPDVSYLVENQNKIKAMVLTHGHEDHIGAIPYVMKQIKTTIYGGRLTLGLVKAKLEEHRMHNDVKMEPISDESVLSFDHMSVSFFRTNHSIPDSFGIAIETPEGTVVHTGDFKFDLTPVGHPTDFAKIAELGQKGVLALLSDSTNSERPGFTMSERTVGESIAEVVGKAKGRIILATFASNVHRLQQVVDAAVIDNRKIAVIGRSMEKAFLIGQELGYIQVPEGVLIDIKTIDNYTDNQVLIICTGSQGEPMAALTRIASGSHRSVQIYPEDTVIISASPIPGNAVNVSRIIDKLYRAGANVVQSSVFDIHASGHGSSEELRLMLSFIQPKNFIPIHGEYRMLKRHGLLAEQVGVEPENIFIVDNGEVISCTREGARVTEKVQAGVVLIDGSGIGDVGNIVLRDRKHLAEDGLMVVVVSIDMKQFKLLTGPDIVSRGFVYVRGSESLIQEATVLVKQKLLETLDRKVREWSELKSQINQVLKPFIFEKTGRNPMILTIVMEV